MQVFSKSLPLKTTRVYDTYWKFAAERQAIFFKRFRRESRPWTQDSILAKHKFTNAYRASDRVSQYLIRNVLYRGDQSPNDIFFRCLIFKIFNRIDTWELLTDVFDEVRLCEYSFQKYDELLEAAKRSGKAIFSAAYIMPSRGAGFCDHSKHRNYLALLETMIREELPSRLLDAKSMAESFQMLLNYPLIGNFLAYQLVTDLNYSGLTNFSEMEFVVAGPGAKDGIRKCFEATGDMRESDIIRFVCDRQNEEFSRLGLNFQTLWDRPLQLIDCQNLFCEVDKYSRIAHPEVLGISGRTRIKQKFTANSQVIDYWFPPKWGINERISAFVHNDERKREL